MMKLQLPSHSQPCHSITIYDGPRYIEEHRIVRGNGHAYLDVSGFSGEDIRFEHSAADARGNKQPPEYRSICRLDGVWVPYKITEPAWGLPELAKAEVEPEITDLHPADGLDVVGQDDPQSEGEKPAESLTPAKEKKSRTSR